jgi:hypothetical protein
LGIFGLSAALNKAKSITVEAEGHPERSAAKSKDSVAIPANNAMRFIHFARNDRLV